MVFHIRKCEATGCRKTFYATVQQLLTEINETEFHFEILGPHGSENVDAGLLSNNAMCSYREIQEFRKNILPPTSRLTTEALCSL
jgi:hypothetical protein